MLFLRHAFKPDPPVNWCPAAIDLPEGRLQTDTTDKEGDFSTGGELQQVPRPFSWRKAEYLHKLCTGLMICYVRNRKQLKGCAVLEKLRWMWTGGFRTMLLWQALRMRHLRAGDPQKQGCASVSTLQHHTRPRTGTSTGLDTHEQGLQGETVPEAHRGHCKRNDVCLQWMTLLRDHEAFSREPCEVAHLLAAEV